jgi:hypothetical protein
MMLIPPPSRWFRQFFGYEHLDAELTSRFPVEAIGLSLAHIHCEEMLDGLLTHYSHRAA